MTASEEQELKNSLLNFAIAFAEVVGTEETKNMLVALTAFAKTNPGTLLEIKDVVEENPDTVASLMTPKGIQEAKETIALVKSLNLF